MRRSASQPKGKRLQLGELGGAFQERGIGMAKPHADDGSFGISGSFKRMRTIRSNLFHPQQSPTNMKTASAGMMASLLAARRSSKPWYIIDPRRSQTFLPAWDSLTTLCLLFTALVTPFEVAFLTMPRTIGFALRDPLFLCNRVIDVAFGLDIILNFLLMYQDSDRIDGVKWVDEPSTIARHYLRSWFALDLFSMLPSTFDILPYAFGDSATSAVGAAGGALDNKEEEILTRFKFLRVVRCLRLIKLMRLLRASRMMTRWETR